MDMMNNSGSRSLFLALILFISTSFNPARSQVDSGQNQNCYIFFDLGKVLIESSKLSSFTKNSKNILKYLFRHGVPDGAALKSRLFEMMDFITGMPRGSATDEEPLPGIMCDWLEGKITSKEFVAIITNINLESPFFRSKTEGKLLIRIAQLMLPENLVAIHKSTKMLKTFQWCCQQNPGKVCILSNWDNSSAELLKAKFPEIFNCIPEENIIFSGECGYKKPDYGIYKIAAERVRAKPDECVLIDDQLENIAAANAFGWHGILHENTEKTSALLKGNYVAKQAA